ncbi:MAG: Thymidylate kinase [Peptococcaceae bacterium]|jgi:dTMP kinase|nr:Thymidylate kinase [Peptococcaceae bacterium]
MTKKGKFIVLEGVDGSGITTQTSLLRTWLEENEAIYGRTFFTKEPTDGPAGGQIRLALAKRLKPLDERMMALLFAADRMDHLYCTGENEQNSGIVAKLEKGINVISDRYYLSSFAYQSLQVDLAWLRQINAYCIKPDLTILLQLPISESIERRSRARFHEELYEREDYLIQISRNYLEIAGKLQAEGENILIVNALRDKKDVFAEIQEAIKKLFT